jgi:hypothetical protein
VKSRPDSKLNSFEKHKNWKFGEVKNSLLKNHIGGSISIGERPEYRPFHDLRSVPEAGRPREHVKNRGVQALLLGTAALGAGIFSLLK